MASFDFGANALNNFKVDEYVFSSNFDSGNLGKVQLKERLSADAAQIQGYHVEFDTWTTPDCYGTPKESTNRTWFFFSVRGGKPNQFAKINVKNLNRQFKLFSQGMQPVMKIGSAGKWERINGKPEFYNDEDDFVISFLHRPEKPYVEQYYAFTYPFTYACCQKLLSKYDTKYGKTNEETKNLIDKLHRLCEHQKDKKHRKTKIQTAAAKSRIEKKTNLSILNTKCSQIELQNTIYYNRELLITSLEGRRVDLVTISSFNGITKKKESCLENLFPEGPSKRSYTFKDKKIIFLSARVHPGETPASFVLNGFLSLLLDTKSSIAHVLRSLYVFKIVPMLNPDGVYRGFYRTDTLGQNLNRMYLCPQLQTHPTIYAVKKLIRFLRFGMDGDDSDTIVPYPGAEYDSESGCSADEATSCTVEKNKLATIAQPENIINAKNVWLSNDIKLFVPIGQSDTSTTESITQCNKVLLLSKESSSIEKSTLEVNGNVNNENEKCVKEEIMPEPVTETVNAPPVAPPIPTHCDNLFLYIDFHGHASKKGIFMYGNHFSNISDAVECKLLPKIMSINNPNFHYDSCNFTEKNMYKTEKRDGLSKEGSGRVTIYKVTGLIRSYTLECNYNTGKYVNNTTSTPASLNKKNGIPTPPKYSPSIFEDVGRALGPSILDITNSNPCSRLQHSEGRSLQGLRSILRTEVERLNAVRRTSDNRKVVTKNIQTSRRIKRPKGVTSPSPTQKPTKDNKSTKLTRCLSGKTSQQLSSANTTKIFKSEFKSKTLLPTANNIKREALSLTFSKAIGNKLNQTKTLLLTNPIKKETVIDKKPTKKEMSLKNDTREDTSCHFDASLNTISITFTEPKEISPKIAEDILTKTN